MYPNFIIAGAAKSGSTTIFDLLKHHPQICMSNVKEPNIFLHNRGKEKEYYRKYFSHYHHEKWIGEATVAYFAEVSVAKRIFEINPEMKFIFTLRNPVHQFYSNYWHRVRKGHEYRSWEEVLQGDLDGNLYASSFYFKNLISYTRYFPLKNIHFIIFEEMVQNMGREYQKILDFLNLPKEETLSPEIWSNKGYIFRSQKVGFTINKIRTTKLIYNLIPPILRPMGKGFLNRIEKINKSHIHIHPIKLKDERFLRKIFMEDIEHLEVLLKKSLPW